MSLSKKLIGNSIDNFANLNAVKQAEVVNKLILEGENQVDIGKMVGVSVSQVSNLKLIHSMPRILKKLIEDDKISATLVLHARREERDMSDEDLAAFLNDIYVAKNQEKKEQKVQLKDITKAVDKQNSIAIVRKFLRHHSYNSVRKNHPLFELLTGIMDGTVGISELNKVFGIKLA